jgi:methionyl-tRNA formyltransferase
MYMDDGLDTGDVLLQKRIEIAPDDTGGSLHDRLGQIAPAALSDALAQLANGTAPRTPQDSSLATYAPKLEREDGRIDWNEPAESIERKIRAFNPWPGAFTLITDASGKGRKLKIFSGSVVPLVERPGRLFLVNDDVEITSGKGGISLGDVQLEGKRRMSAKEFIRGHHFQVDMAR